VDHAEQGTRSCPGGCWSGSRPRRGSGAGPPGAGGKRSR
jgi:hypothetical protein